MIIGLLWKKISSVEIFEREESPVGAPFACFWDNESSKITIDMDLNG